MGTFVHVGIILNCSESDVRTGILNAERLSSLDVVAEDCIYKEYRNGVCILFNDGCCGYEELARILSKDTERPFMLLYIYDGDYWGYYFYDCGNEIDSFNPMPDYFEIVSDQERSRLAGNSDVVAKYFDVYKEVINDYLMLWTDERMCNYEKKTYHDDEFGQCDCWQIVDFMKKLSFPYEW